MAAKITACRNPRFVKPDQTSIFCEVCLDSVPQWLPYHAMSTDPDPQGHQLFTDIVAGKYGPVAPYQPPAAKPAAAEGQGPRAIG